MMVVILGSVLIIFFLNCCSNGVFDDCDIVFVWCGDDDEDDDVR